MQAAAPHEGLAHVTGAGMSACFWRASAPRSRRKTLRTSSPTRSLRAQLRAESEPPESEREAAWFARVVLNLEVHFLRARDGRRRNGASPRPTIVPLTHVC
jgi:hypothetical protein